MKALTSQQSAAISRLFSSSVVRELARRGKSPLFTKLARQSSLLSSLSASRKVYDLFDAAFALLQCEGYRDEYTYKAALVKRVLLGRHSLQTASMLCEFRVGQCKADLVILNGTATVYEIKSERDSLSRLQKQIAAYSEVFGRVNVIASEDHVSAIVRSVPDYVGIHRLNRRYQVSTIREAIDRPENISAAAIFDAIRTQEASMILTMNGYSVPDVPNTALHATLRELFITLRPTDAHEGLVKVLKKTRNLLPLSALIEQLPHSLHTAALAVPLRKLDHARLVDAVNTPLRIAETWA